MSRRRRPVKRHSASSEVTNSRYGSTTLAKASAHPLLLCLRALRSASASSRPSRINEKTEVNLPLNTRLPSMERMNFSTDGSRSCASRLTSSWRRIRAFSAGRSSLTESGGRSSTLFALTRSSHPCVMRSARTRPAASKIGRSARPEQVAFSLNALRNRSTACWCSSSRGKRANARAYDKKACAEALLARLGPKCIQDAWDPRVICHSGKQRAYCSSRAAGERWFWLFPSSRLRFEQLRATVAPASLAAVDPGGCLHRQAAYRCRGKTYGPGLGRAQASNRRRHK